MTQRRAVTTKDGLHIGVDAESGLAHSLATTAANAADVTQACVLLHGDETEAWGDAGYQGVDKRPENRGCDVAWQVAMKPGKRRLLDRDGAEAAAEKRKASVRAKVEHPFLYVKRRFGYGKVRYRGLAKNTQRIALLLGFSNLPAFTGRKRGTRIHGIECRRARSMTTGHTRGRRCTCWCPSRSRWEGRIPASMTRSTWAESSRRTASSDTTPEIIRGTRAAYPDTNLPSAVTSRPRCSGSVSGCSSTSVRWTPTSSSGFRRQTSSASSNASPAAESEALLTMPSPCAISMPRLMSRWRPKSSAFTTSRRSELTATQGSSAGDVSRTTYVGLPFV